jgi:esterase/lipase superfamily enzyme
MSFCATRRRFLASLSATLALGTAGCLPDVTSVGSVMTPAVAPPDSFRPSILAITTRRAVKSASAAPWFGHERSASASLARVVFNAPNTTVMGQAQAAWYGSRTIKSVTADPRDITEALPPAIEGREVLLYVHGYKESFESAVTGGVELSEGVSFQGERVVFSWPSRAALFDYGYDRESAMISRDAFEETLLKLLGEGGASRVHIVAHSMGTLLTIEALRQLWARYGDVYAGRIGAIVLASPDIDFDLFENALRRLRSLSQKITVISSTTDRALEVSRRLAGGVTRVGAASREQLEGLGVRVVDASDYGGWAIIKHDLFLTDPDVRAVVRRAVERGRG